ncbi:hypothetical protein RCIP0073_00041 [Klebsiella phage RCIP0073]|nr:holin [Klebsiella phage vB_KpnS_SXFY507]
MRDFINAATTGGGGVTAGGLFSGQILIALAGLFLMFTFGVWGGYLRWKDSKALREALDAGDIRTAIKIRSK